MRSCYQSSSHPAVDFVASGGADWLPHDDDCPVQATLQAVRLSLRTQALVCNVDGCTQTFGSPLALRSHQAQHHVAVSVAAGEPSAPSETHAPASHPSAVPVHTSTQGADPPEIKCTLSQLPVKLQGEPTTQAPGQNREISPLVGWAVPQSPPTPHILVPSKTALGPSPPRVMRVSSSPMTAPIVPQSHERYTTPMTAPMVPQSRSYAAPTTAAIVPQSHERYTAPESARERRGPPERTHLVSTYTNHPPCMPKPQTKRSPQRLVLHPMQMQHNPSSSHRQLGAKHCSRVRRSSQQRHQQLQQHIVTQLQLRNSVQVQHPLVQLQGVAATRPGASKHADAQSLPLVTRHVDVHMEDLSTTQLQYANTRPSTCRQRPNTCSHDWAGSRASRWLGGSSLSARRHSPTEARVGSRGGDEAYRVPRTGAARVASHSRSTQQQREVPLALTAPTRWMERGKSVHYLALRSTTIPRPNHYCTTTSLSCPEEN